VDAEITPQPSAEERAAILAALAQEAEELQEGAPAERGAPQDFFMNDEDSVRP
jgi:hypothetical protein